MTTFHGKKIGALEVESEPTHDKAAAEIMHQIDLHLASGARLRLLYFSAAELRWIFSYHYVGASPFRAQPDVLNKVTLVADYIDGVLAPSVVLAMHVIIPSRLWQEYYLGVDISPDAKTYLEFHYERTTDATTYRLIEIHKNARERVRLDDLAAGLVRPISFPFPIPDRLAVDGMQIRVPFRLNSVDLIGHFELPTRTVR